MTNETAPQLPPLPEPYMRTPFGTIPPREPLLLYTAEQMRAYARAALATQPQAPVAWGLFAKVEDGSWHLQHPVRFTEEDAKADRSMYERTTAIEIRPLYDQGAHQ